MMKPIGRTLQPPLHEAPPQFGEGETSGAADYPRASPQSVATVVMEHTWSQLSLVHWPYEPEIVQRLLPEPLSVDVMDGAAWIGLVPFHLTITPRRFPRIPWVSSFEEMNVRTYVRGPDGVPGVWFITLDAGRLGAVLIARLTYRLNYFWSKMAFTRVGNVVTYSSRRRWPGPSRALGTFALEIGPRMRAEELEALDHFLTGRWSFYCTIGKKLFRADIEHEPWPLARAHLLHCDPGLVTACGLPPPADPPLVHYSESVDVRMGPPKPVL